MYLEESHEESVSRSDHHGGASGRLCHTRCAAGDVPPVQVFWSVTIKETRHEKRT